MRLQVGDLDLYGDKYHQRGASQNTRERSGCFHPGHSGTQALSRGDIFSDGLEPREVRSACLRSGSRFHFASRSALVEFSSPAKSYKPSPQTDSILKSK